MLSFGIGRRGTGINDITLCSFVCALIYQRIELEVGLGEGSGKRSLDMMLTSDERQKLSR